jgi:hypothetical protein
MNFKIKNFLQKTFSVIPFGSDINYFFQRFITKSLPPNLNDFITKIRIADEHLGNFIKYNTLPRANINYYEFGAGWNLAIPLYFSAKGFHVNCIDIRKLTKNDLILDSLDKIESINSSFFFNLNDFNKSNVLSVLKSKYRFNYVAPVDARATNFSDCNFGFMSSSVTLEHIPPNDILGILLECYRILDFGGILSMEIDYKDHWSYSDGNISIYNFLKFSPREWIKFNPSLHYQNRLRHSDYINIIKKTEFEIIDIKPDFPTELELSQLKNIPISDYLRDYTFEDISIKGSIIVLRKNSN